MPADESDTTGKAWNCFQQMGKSLQGCSSECRRKFTCTFFFTLSYRQTNTQSISSLSLLFKPFWHTQIHVWSDLHRTVTRDDENIKMVQLTSLVRTMLCYIIHYLMLSKMQFKGQGLEFIKIW